MKCLTMIKSIMLLCISCGLLLCWPCGSCWAGQVTYTITAEELDRWQAELNLQKALINKQIQNERKLQLELITLRGQLTESKRALTNQQTLLASSQQALTDANNLLTAYEKEVRRKRNRYRWQRTLAYSIATSLAYALIVK